MAVYQMHYDEEDLHQYPSVKAFLSTNAKKKSDAFFSALELVLEAYSSNGLGIPESKTDINSLINFISNSKVVNNYMISAFSGNPVIATAQIKSNPRPKKSVSKTEESNKKKVQRQSSNKSFTKVNTKSIVNQEEDDDTDAEVEALFNSYEDSSTIEKESTGYVDTRSPGDRAMDEEFLGI